MTLQEDNDRGLYKVYTIEGLTLTGDKLSMLIPENRYIVSMSFAEGSWYIVTLPDVFDERLAGDDEVHITVRGGGFTEDDILRIIDEIDEGTDEGGSGNGGGNTIN